MIENISIHVTNFFHFDINILLVFLLYQLHLKPKSHQQSFFVVVILQMYQFSIDSFVRLSMRVVWLQKAMFVEKCELVHRLKSCLHEYKWSLFVRKAFNTTWRLFCIAQHVEHKARIHDLKNTFESEKKTKSRRRGSKRTRVYLMGEHW